MEKTCYWSTSEATKLLPVPVVSRPYLPLIFFPRRRRWIILVIQWAATGAIWSCLFSECYWCVLWWLVVGAPSSFIIFTPVTPSGAFHWKLRTGCAISFCSFSDSDSILDLLVILFVRTNSTFSEKKIHANVVAWVHLFHAPIFNFENTNKRIR